VHMGETDFDVTTSQLQNQRYFQGVTACIATPQIVQKQWSA